MPPRRPRKRRSRIVPTVVAVLIGLATASGVYWHQNRDVEPKLGKSIIDQVEKQLSPREQSPESFTAITATDTPKPPTRAVPTTKPKETSEFRNVVRKLPQILYEPKEERQAREEAESAAKVVELERKVHAGINAERAQNGGSLLLRWVDQLGMVARAHSEDMTKRGYFSHDTPEGLGPTDRIEKAGYSCWKGSHYGVAENIAIEMASKDLDRIAAAEVKSWMDSPGHRVNLLNRQYDRTGVGVSFGKWRGYNAVYLTQVFC